MVGNYSDRHFIQWTRNTLIHNFWFVSVCKPAKDYGEVVWLIICTNYHLKDLEYDRNRNLQALTRNQPGIMYLVSVPGIQISHFPGSGFGSWFDDFPFYWYNQELQALFPGWTKYLLVYQEVLGLTKKKPLNLNQQLNINNIQQLIIVWTNKYFQGWLLFSSYIVLGERMF